MAERKVNSCLPPNHPLDREPDIERICGAGVDPAFDKLIGSLGYIARHKPKPVIDSLMIWRKSKSDAAAFSRGAGHDTPRGHQMLPRRNTEPVQPMDGNTPRESSLVADRRTTVAIYILCRVLIEVIGQTTLDRVTEDMQRLEEIIFNQLQSADPDVLATSPLRHANWTLFSQLLGVMSSIDFEPVTDQFFQALEQAKSSAPATREQEAKTALVVRGMGYIKLKVHLCPLHALRIHLHSFVVLPRKCLGRVRRFYGFTCKVLQQCPWFPRQDSVLRDLQQTTPASCFHSLYRTQSSAMAGIRK